MDNAKLIKLLNKSLQYEYSDVFLYPRHADLIKEKDMLEKFEQFGRMEVRHADNLAMQIIILGGKPEWEFVRLDVKGSLNEILLEHLRHEKEGIQLYGNIIEFLDKEPEDQVKLIIRGIMAEEQEHFKTINSFLNRKS